MLLLTSSLYALDTLNALSSSRILFLNFILCFFLANYLDSISKIKKTLDYVVISGVLASLFLMITSFNPGEIVRLGESLGALNRLALLIAVSFVIALHSIIYERNKKYIFYCLAMTPFLLLSGSRNAIIFALIGSLIMIFMKYKGTIWGNIKILIYLCLGTVGFYVIVFKIPQVYSVLGIRLESMLSFLTTGEAIAERSIQARSYMIEFGIEKFKQKPFWGYGINNYSVLNMEYAGRSVYSHSDFIEILVGVGIVGTVIYYSIYINSIMSLMKKKFLYKSMNDLFLALSISFFITSFTTVHYYLKHFWFFFTIIAAFNALKSSDGKRSAVTLVNDN